MKLISQSIVSTVAVLVLAAGPALSQNRAPGPSQDVPGYGPGMMGGYGMGPGMMGGYGPGTGMMGGYGSGARMMGGYATGPGLMGPWHFADIQLDSGQRAQVSRISDELRKRNWEVAGKLEDEAATMRDLFAADTLDKAAIVAAHRRMTELRQTMFENALDARIRIEAVLTPEQRRVLRDRG